jgi:AbrB family looped-hinge helix DNA binding protein
MERRRRREKIERRPQAVKLGATHQVVIPKRIVEELDLTPGDYLEVELQGGKVTFTPKALVDRPRPADK